MVMEQKDRLEKLEKLFYCYFQLFYVTDRFKMKQEYLSDMRKCVVEFIEIVLKL